MLDARPLAGDTDLCADARDAVLAPLRADPARSPTRSPRTRAIARSVRLHVLPVGARAEGGGGGLRDIHALGWLVIVRGRPLEDGLLRAAERDGSMRPRSSSRGCGAPCTWRRAAGRTGSCSSSSRGRAAMGFEDEPGLIAVDGLMRAVFEHARAVDARRTRCSRATGDPEVRRLRRPGAWPRGLGGRRCREAARVLPRGRSMRSRPPIPATSGMDRRRSRRVPAARSERAAGVPVSRSSTASGLLARLLPEWARPCRPQRDPYHRFSVDVHLLRALGGMALALAAPDGPIPGGGRARADHRPRRRAPGRAPARHRQDRGGRPRPVGGGSRRGPGADGPAGADRELAQFMVAEHLLLPDTATRRDLTTTTSS